jgi:hypothetical protein
MIGRGGTVDSSQRGYGELGTVELVEPGSAVDEDGLVVPWQEFVVRQSRQTRSVAWCYPIRSRFDTISVLAQVSLNSSTRLSSTYEYATKRMRRISHANCVIRRLRMG